MGLGTASYLFSSRFQVRIETRQAATLANQRIIVAIDSWPRTSRYPLGHFVRALGKIGDKATENQVEFFWNNWTPDCLLVLYCTMYICT